MPRAWLLLLLAGCARGAGPTPFTTVSAYLHADARAAFLLLSRPLRDSLTERDFALRWSHLAGERKAQAVALGPLTARPPVENARAVWSDGREAQLAHDAVGWRLSSPRISAGGAASPEDAIHQFATALDRRDLDGLLDLLEDPLRSLVERELSERLARLKAAEHKDIQVEGKRARIRLDERYFIELRQEGGRWKITDFN